MAEADTTEHTRAEDRESMSQDDCPVCTEVYRDPRILECAHHFCKVCLEQIAERHPERYVTCPTCRHVTKSDDVTELPRYRIVNDFISSVNAAAEGAGKSDEMTEKDERFCQICEQPDAVATKFCSECPIQLCDKCADEKHGATFKEHTVYSMSPLIFSAVFCDSHAGNVCITICKTCNKTCCVVCQTREHTHHDWKYIKEEGKSIKCKIEETKKVVGKDEKPKATIKRIDFILEKAKMIRNRFTNNISETKKAIEIITKKVAKFEEDVKSKLDADIKMLEMMKVDMDDFMESKTKLAQHLDQLLTNCTDHELLVRKKETPTYDPEFYMKLLSETAVKLPDLKPALADMGDKITLLTKEINVEYLDYNLLGVNPNPISNLRKLDQFSVGYAVCGIVVDEQRERLFVRRKDPESPITVFDYSGKKLDILGKGVLGIASEEHQGISIDTKRDVLLVPIAGSLVKMDLAGNVLQKGFVTTSTLHKITHTDDDFYVASKKKTPRLIMMNPDTLFILKTFVDTTGTIRPYSVASTTMDGMNCLYVTFYHTNRVVCVDDTGTILHSLDRVDIEGHQCGNLKQPYDILVDPAGRVIICDEGNKRIVSAGRQNTHGNWDWELLLGKDALAPITAPRYLTFDRRKHILFVADSGLPTPGTVISFSPV